MTTLARLLSLGLRLHTERIETTPPGGATRTYRPGRRMRATWCGLPIPLRLAQAIWERTL